MSNSNLWTYREGTISNGDDLVGYDVEASDGSIGKIDASTVDADTAHVVVDKGWWIFGKKRLIPAGTIASVDHAGRTVAIQMTKDEIKNAPDFDESMTFTDDSDDRRVYDDYYRPFGW
jgi:hypothetical protein